MRARFYPLLMVIVLVAGCAFQKSLKRGDQAMRAGDYAAAYGNYQNALTRRPNNSKAKQRVAAARAAVIERALRNAEAAIDAGDYHAALEHLDRADAYARPGEEPAAELRARAQKTAEDQARSALAAGDFWLAYQHALDSAELFGRNPALIADVRQAALEDTADAASSGEHPRAWSQYHAILSFEPELEEEIAPKIGEQRDAWVARLHDEAEEAQEEGDEGFAALSYALAAALDESDDAIEPLVVRLRDQHDLEVRWEVRGAEQVVGPVRKALRDTFGHSTSSSDFTLEALVREFCETSRSTRVESTDYLAGTRMVDNPRKAELARDLANARLELERADDDLAQAERELQRTRARVEPLLARADQIDADIRRLEDQKRQEELQLETDEEYLRESKRKLNRMKADNDADPMTIASWEEHVWQAEAAVETSRQRVRTLEDQIRQLESKRSSLGVSSATNRLQYARESADDEAREYDAQAERVRQLELDFHNEPAQIEEEVWNTLDYPITTVTRTCTASVGLKAGGAGSGTQAISISSSSSDETHDAYPVANVSEDPLHIPASDASLIAKAAATAGGDAADQGWSWLADAHARLLSPTDDANADVERHIAVCSSRSDLLTNASYDRLLAVAQDRVYGFETAYSAELPLPHLCL